MWSHLGKEETAFHIYTSFRGGRVGVGERGSAFEAQLAYTFYGGSMRMPAKWSLIPTHRSCFNWAMLLKNNPNSAFQMTIYLCSLQSMFVAWTLYRRSSEILLTCECTHFGCNKQRVVSYTSTELRQIFVGIVLSVKVRQTK